jgi:hypothetical protein
MHKCIATVADVHRPLCGVKVFWIKVREKEETVSVDRLKPHTGKVTVQPAAPPKQGRPPGSAPAANAKEGPVENGIVVCNRK